MATLYDSLAPSLVDEFSGANTITALPTQPVPIISNTGTPYIRLPSLIPTTQPISPTTTAPTAAGTAPTQAAQPTSDTALLLGAISSLFGGGGSAPDLGPYVADNSLAPADTNAAPTQGSTTMNWKWIAGIVIAAGVVYWYMKRKKGSAKPAPKDDSNVGA